MTRCFNLCVVDFGPMAAYFPRLRNKSAYWRDNVRAGANLMKIRNSLKTLKNRHRDCRIVRRRGRLYVINKTQRRFKARQG